MAERIPDYFDIDGRLHTVHHKIKPMTREEFLQRIDLVVDQEAVTISGKQIIGGNDSQSVQLSILVDVSEMSDIAFESHLEKL